MVCDVAEYGTKPNCPPFNPAPALPNLYQCRLFFHYEYVCFFKCKTFHLPRCTVCEMLFKLWEKMSQTEHSMEPPLHTAPALSKSRCYKVYRNQNIIFLFPLHSSKHLVNTLWSHPRNLVCGRNDRISWSNGASKRGRKGEGGLSEGRGWGGELKGEGLMKKLEVLVRFKCDSHIKFESSSLGFVCTSWAYSLKPFQRAGCDLGCRGADTLRLCRTAVGPIITADKSYWLC